MFYPEEGFHDGSHSDNLIGTTGASCGENRTSSAEFTGGVSDWGQRPGVSVAALDADHQGDIEGGYWEAVDSGLFGDLSDYTAMAGEEEQVDRASSLCRGEEPAFFLSQHTSHITETKEVAALLQDLSPEQVVVFRFLATQIRSIFKKRNSAPMKIEVMEWMFTAGSLIEHAAFEDCCAALDCRPWVMRLRIHLEFWRKDMQLAEKIKGLIVPAPERLLEETYALAGASGSWLLHRVWEFPGISSERLCRNQEDRNALDVLDDAGILLPSYQRFWYCVGRSPNNRAGLPRSQSWSSFWRNF